MALARSRRMPVAWNPCLLWGVSVAITLSASYWAPVGGVSFLLSISRDGQANEHPDKKQIVIQKVNSSTHPAAYKEFTRLAKRPHDFPVALADDFQKNKANLFALFVQHGKDINKVSEVAWGMNATTDEGYYKF